jgi:hypothetical protein
VFYPKYLIAALAFAPIASAQPAEHIPLQLNFEQRVRNENWNNLLDFSDMADDQRNQIRYRTRLWLDAPLPANIDLHVGLAQETNQKIGKDNCFDEVFFETAYLDFHKLFTDKLSLRVGRLNFNKGDGFILSEGGPLDGTRTTYFNGFDLAYASPLGDLELIGILDPKRDRFLPRIHDQNRLLVDWDEQAIGAYFTRKFRTASRVEAYYFIKKELHDYRAPTNPLYQPDRRVNTAGVRTVRQIDPALSVTAEFALQRGVQSPGLPIRAWGGYAYAKRTFTHPLHPYAKAGYWAFSGSTRPGFTGDWDPLFSRTATYGDLDLYSEMYERSTAYISNLKMAQLEAGFAPSKRLSYKFTWQHLTAFHPTAVNPHIFGTGLGRGENLQARADFTLNPNLRGHVDFETLLPGSFYTVADRAYFLRFEMIYSFKTRLLSHLKPAHP